MKDSGLPSFGIVPKDWKTTKLKNILLIRKEKSFGYGRLLSVYLDRGVISYDDSTGKQVHKPSEDLSDYQRVYINDFVLNNQQAWRGSVGVSQYDGIISPAYYVYQFSPDCIPCYMNYVLRDKCMVQQYEIASRGVGSIQRNLFIPDFRTISMYLPLPSEQTQIVHFLDRKCTAIDIAIEKTKKSIEKLEEYKKAVITKAVTKGIDPNVKMKDSGVEWIGEIPEEWKISKFKFHAKAKSEKNPGNATILSLYREYGIVIKDSRDDNHNRTSLDTSSYRYVEVNDFVVNKMKAWQGSVAVSEYTGVVSPAYYVYKITDAEIYPLYLHYLLRSCYKDEFRRLSGGIRIGQWDLPSEALENTLILQPSYTEQVNITEYIKKHTTAVEQLIEKKKKAIEKWEEYKKSLIYYAVTGKIDCRGEEL
ncbi:MAG: restriction endonuclease subunit S [Erysipelotrichia bacterium]|nr:restriction endonuclease subunit S [Erysipelotrichia bacterium]